MELKVWNIYYWLNECGQKIQKIMASDSSNEPKTWLGNSKRKQEEEEEESKARWWKTLFISHQEKAKKALDTNWRSQESREILIKAEQFLSQYWSCSKSAESQEDYKWSTPKYISWMKHEKLSHSKNHLRQDNLLIKKSFAVECVSYNCIIEGEICTQLSTVDDRRCEGRAVRCDV